MPYTIFEHYAERYDTWYTRHPMLARNEARAVATAVRKRPVAEIGAGTGFFADLVKAEAALDPSLQMLLEGKRKHRWIEAVQALGEQLPLRSSSIGTVLLVVTLCFLDNPYPVLQEATRVLKPRGELVACIVPRNSPWGRHYQQKARQGHPLYRVARFYTVEETIALLEQHGLAPRRILTTLHNPPTMPPEPEEPREEPPWEAENAGFACITAEKPEQDTPGHL